MDRLHFIDDYEQKFKALADKKRLAILYELSQHREICVCDLEKMVDLPQSKLSYHIKLLLEADLINCRKEGRWNYYRINEKVMKCLLSDDACCVFYPPQK
ncbi:ArsR family transcriptional regulator [Sporolactobacillus sp. THM7-7]|nr:ArsR family transcriptional regulator [Sporolactobacillus sp. THM7-7]